MSTSHHLSLPYILPAQAQKHVTHNEAISALDTLVMLSVTSRSLETPPPDPEEGERYIVAAAATGDWAAHEGCISSRQSGSWELFSPNIGWRCWCADEARLLVWDGTAWRDPVSHGLGTLEHLGVNATADDHNRLAVAAEGTLLTHAGGSHRLAINKSASADTASLIFQDDYSGRAEIGLSGDDSFTIKVSPDGASFTEALKIDPATARPTFPAASFLENFAVNLYSDNGMLGLPVAGSYTVGAFDFPGYLTLYNGAVAVAHGKFKTNNNDYGGSSGALDVEVRSLIDQIRDPSRRRYGIEFWVAEITAGAGTATSPVVIGEKTFYLSLFKSFTPRPPAMTFHAYVKAVDEDIAWRLYPGQTAYADGVTRSETFAITPSDGWVSVTVHDEQDPYSNFGYNPTPLTIHAIPGKTYLIACPALMGGIVKVDDTIGVIAAGNNWTA